MLEHLDPIEPYPIEPYKFPYGDYTIIGDKSEIDTMINTHGYMNIDVGDVERVLSKTSPNYVTTGYGEGGNGLLNAFNQSINKLPISLSAVSHILFNIYVPKTNDITTKQLDNFLKSDAYCDLPANIFVFWGVAVDESLDNEIKVTLIASSK